MIKSRDRQIESKNLPSWFNPIASTRSYEVAFTSRGDVGPEASAYQSFNPCHYTGDTPGHISDSSGLLTAWLGISDDALVIPRQTHSTVVRFIDSIPVSQSELEGVDALVTKLRSVAIGVSTADCVPVALIDDNAGIIAVAHAGWRGAVDGIIGKTVKAMVGAGASAPCIRAFFGPAICGDCFEVGEEVAARFPADCVQRKEQWPKPHVDLPAYVGRCLVEAGLKLENVAEFDSGICTRCHPDRYFSARAAGVESGRNFTFIMLR